MLSLLAVDTVKEVSSLDLIDSVCPLLSFFGYLCKKYWGVTIITFNCFWFGFVDKLFLQADGYFYSEQYFHVDFT